MAKRQGKKKPRRGRRGKRDVRFVAEAAGMYGVRAPAELPPGERFISPNQAAKIMNVTGEAVKQWIYNNRLPATKLPNGYWKIKVGDFEKFIRARQEVGRRRVLMVDSENDGEDKFAEEVAKLGQRIVFAHSLADAMLKAADIYPALFILNASMKGLDPWALATKFRQMKSVKNVPILFLSDRDLNESESEKALALGAQGFMRKPVTPAALVKEIERILNRAF